MTHIRHAVVSYRGGGCYDGGINAIDIKKLDSEGGFGIVTKEAYKAIYISMKRDLVTGLSRLRSTTEIE